MSTKCRDCGQAPTFYVSVAVDGGVATLEADAYFCSEHTPIDANDVWSAYVDGSQHRYGVSWVARAMDIEPADILQYEVARIR